jgi:drug/metabolite transporter (DMT)-like permease
MTSPLAAGTSPEEMELFKSIRAVAIGFVLIGALSFTADAVVHKFVPSVFIGGRTDSIPILVLTIVYVAMFSIVGSYTTAHLAPKDPMKHSVALGILGLIFSTIGAVTMWSTAPIWYHVVSLALVMPYAWVGGRLRENELKTGTSEIHLPHKHQTGQTATG